MVCLFVVPALVGCQPDMGQAPVSTSVGTPAPSTAGSTSSAGGVQRTLVESSRVEVPLTGEQPDWVTLVPGIGFAYESGPLYGRKKLYLYDTTTRQQTVVAHLPAGGLTWLSASAEYLVWGQQARLQQTPTAPVTWKTFSYALGTGQRSLLGRGVSTAPPLPRVFGSTAYWAEFLGFDLKRFDIWKENLATGKRHRVLTHVRSAQMATNGRVLVYNLTWEFHPNRRTYSTDLFALFKDRQDPVRLTHLGKVDMPTIDHNTVAFYVGFSGHVAALQFPDRKVIDLADGDQGFLTAGDGFVADLADGPEGQTVRVISVLDPTHTPTFLTLLPQSHVSVRCGISVVGDQVAWGVQEVDSNGVYGRGTAIISTISSP